ncbi:MAG: hypothetical protein ACKOW9_00365 [Candidatus Paceibacterota bacterium]
MVIDGWWSLMVGGHCWLVVIDGWWSLLVGGHCWLVVIEREGGTIIFKERQGGGPERERNNGREESR